MSGENSFPSITALQPPSYRFVRSNLDLFFDSVPVYTNSKSYLWQVATMSYPRVQHGGKRIGHGGEGPGSGSYPAGELMCPKLVVSPHRAIFAC